MPPTSMSACSAPVARAVLRGLVVRLKAATGLGSLLSGVGLACIGVESAGHGLKPVTIASPETVQWLGVLQGVGVGVLTLGSAGICVIYRLSHRKHRGILSDLEVRRLAQTPIPSPS